MPELLLPHHRKFSLCAGLLSGYTSTSELGPQPARNQIKELKYTKGFSASVEKKLSNERFVNNAPESVVASERKKIADAQAKIAQMEEKLKQMK